MMMAANYSKKQLWKHWLCPPPRGAARSLRGPDQTHSPSATSLARQPLQTGTFYRKIQTCRMATGTRRLLGGIGPWVGCKPPWSLRTCLGLSLTAEARRELASHLSGSLSANTTGHRWGWRCEAGPHPEEGLAKRWLPECLGGWLSGGWASGRFCKQSSWNPRHST